MLYEHMFGTAVSVTSRKNIANLKPVSENNPSPEDLILQEWLSISESKLVFVVWYLGNLQQLAEIQKVLARLRNLQIDFHVEWVAINSQLSLAVKLGVKEEVTILMFREQELLEFIKPETGTAHLLKTLGKYV